MESNIISSGILSKEQVMKLLRIKDERMLLYKNRFKVITKDDTICFDRSELVKKIGTDFSEPFMDLHEASKYLGIKEDLLLEYTRKDIIPFYSIEKVKGGRKLFKKSELDAYLNNPEEIYLDSNSESRNRGYAFNWLKKMFSACLRSDLLPTFLSNREIEIIKSVVVSEKTLEQTGLELNLTRERVRQILEKAARRINMNLFRIFPNIVKENAEYKKKYEALIVKNKVLEDSICIMPKIVSGPVIQGFNEMALETYKILSTPLDNMDFTVRALNCLKGADIKTFANLVSYNQEELLRFRNFGKKSFNEVAYVVKEKGLHFGMDVAKYGFTSRGNKQ